MTVNINIRKTHPQLYKTIVACSLVYVSVGLLALTSPKTSLVGTILSSVFIVIGISKMVVLHRLSYKFLQIIQTVGLIYSLFYAILFVVYSGISFQSSEVRSIAWLLPTWIFWVHTQAMTILEPPVNPATEITNGKH